MNLKIFLKLTLLQQKILQSNKLSLKLLRLKYFCHSNLKYLRLGFAGIAAFVWWCVFYPELCFPQDTYEAVYEMQMDEEADVYSLLQAEGDRIVVKSRLLEWIKQHIDE